MKTIHAFFILISLVFIDADLYAQDETQYFVGNEALEDIEGPWLEVKFGRRGKLKPMFIIYGQKCMEEYDGIGVAFEINQPECVGLLDAQGDPIMFTHYMTGVNFLEKKGFKLIEIIPRPETTSLFQASFIFKTEEKR